MRLLWTSTVSGGRRGRALGVLLAVVASCIGGYVAASAVGRPSAPNPSAREGLDTHVRAVAAASAKGLSIKYEQGGKEVPAGQTEGGGIRCPPKYVAIGGGYYGENAHVTAVASNPFNSSGKSLPTPPNGWGFIFVNTDSAPHQVLEFAVCERGAKFQK